MQVVITFNTDNAAFEDSDGGIQGGIYNVLRDIADRVVEQESDFPIRDTNGNTIGRYRHWLGADE